MTRNEAFLKLKNCWSYRHDGTAYINEERIKDVIHQIYNEHEAQLKAKDEEIKELGEIIQQYLIPSKNYDAIIRDKDDEIRRLNNLYADTIKDLGDALIEIERLKEHITHLQNVYMKLDGK